ncbi:transcription antitermination factor NusB [Candidatus Daviesbacteria bacterium]|nr:transcription antitermination factor NusB [Candidatus Daviesbacteria bacterium]
MKTSNDPRHLQRIKVMQELFAWNFKKNSAPGSETGKKIVSNLAQIDLLIQSSAPSWPLDKINRVDLAILRLAVYELMLDKKNPLKVIIDEAVELAKEFGGESSPSFINGALGKLITDNQIMV